MSGLIKSWLNGDTLILRWLAFEDYARKVIGNEHEGWYREPMRYAAGLADANKVLGSQVVSFDFGAVFAANAELAVDSVGAERVSAVLENTAVKAFCADAIAAMSHQLSDRVDVILQLPSPSALLMRLGEESSNIDFDMLDDTATLLADLLRGFAELSIAGVVLAFVSSDVDLGDKSEACEVLQSVAGHYDWVFALRLVDNEQSEGLSELESDLYLMSDLSVTDTAAQEKVCGGGLNKEFWAGKDLSSMDGVCLYGDVPAELDPKSVIERITTLP